MVITPAIAETFLAANTDNRRVSPRNLAFLTKEITSGKWIENGATIIIHKDTGRLIDGQHRLHAVIQANIPITTLVAYIGGSDQDAFLTIDTGKGRSHTDALVMHDRNVKNVSSIVGAMRLIHNDSHSKRATDALTNLDMCTLYDIYGIELLAASKTVHNSNLSKFMPPSPLLYCRYRVNKIDHIKADHFFEVLATGMPTSQTDQPIIVLRDKLMQDRSEPVKMGPANQILCVKIAWNYYIAGKSLAYIRLGGRTGVVDFNKN